MDFSCGQKHFMSYVTFHAIVTTSGPVVERINGRRYWNFMELFVWGKSSGTLWNMDLMDRNNVTGRWVCDDRFYGLVNRSNR